MIKKSDWKTLDMPEENITFTMNLAFTEKDLHWLQEGVLPLSMEDKWFAYYENNQYYFHRSWTGYCIYIVKILDSNTIQVTVNQKEDQYGKINIEEEKERVKRLIEFCARKS